MATPSLIEKFTGAVRSFAADIPGRRFVNLNTHARESGGGGIAFQVFAFVVGVHLVAAGLVLGFIPGVPGIVLGAVGVAFICIPFRTAAVAADSVEESIRNGLRWVFEKINRNPAKPHSVRVAPEVLPAEAPGMPVVDDGQHTGLESRFEEEIVKEQERSKPE